MSKWISVEETAPDNTYCVIVNKDRSLVGIGHWWKGELRPERGWKSHTDVDRAIDVYLPFDIPEPPEEE